MASPPHIVETACGVPITPSRVIGRKQLLGVGCCVTFDSFWKNTPKFVAAGGVSAISMASVPTDIDDPVLNKDALAPHLQHEAARDFSGSLISENADTAEIAVCDFVVERFGVMARGGQVITVNSSFRRGIGRARAHQHGFRFIPMSSDLHFDLWKKSIDIIIEQLQSNCEVILIHKTYAAARNDRFAYTNLMTRFGVNRALDKMYKYVENKKCVEMVEYTKADLIAKYDHKWARSPFHYVDRHYEVVHRKLDELYPTY